MTSTNADIYPILQELFPKDVLTLAVPYPPRRHYPNAKVKVLIDLSNIRISAQHLSIDVDIAMLDLIMTRGRPTNAKVLAGSPSKTDEMIFATAPKLGYRTFALKPRIKEGMVKERGVDDVLAYHILESARSNITGTIALATGDGQPSGTHNLAAGRVGFLDSAKEALLRGWRIELYSFGANLSHNWTVLARRYPKHLAIIYLDEFASFLNQGSLVGL